MGDAIETYCYKCKKKQGPIFLGLGMIETDMQLPAYCPEHKRLLRTTLDNPFCKECSKEMIFVGKFCLLPRLYQPLPKTMVYNCGYDLPPGIIMKELIQ